MKKSNQLVQKREQLRKKADEILAKAKADESRGADAEERQLTTAEADEIDGLIDQMDQLERQIKIEEKLERKEDDNPMPVDFRTQGDLSEGDIKDMKKMSLKRAIELQLQNRALDGVEGELTEEARKEAKGFNQAIDGFGIPRALFDAAKQYQRANNPEEKRAALNVGTGSEGGYAVATDTLELIASLKPQLQTEQLGLRNLTGLTGNIEIPVDDDNLVAESVAELGILTGDDPTLAQRTLSPKRIGTTTSFSRQLFLQSSWDVEAWIAEKLGFSGRARKDLMIINGSGSSNEPLGILNMVGIGSVAIGTNGGAMTHDHVVDLVTAVDLQDALMDGANSTVGYLTTGGVRGLLKKSKIDAGSGIFVWGKAANELNGYNALTSSQVPSNLTKGSGTNLNAVLFGDWSKVICGEWGTMDIIVDPYSQKKKAEIEVTMNHFMDVAIEHPEAMAACVDVALS